jgi:hypothetical protein
MCLPVCSTVIFLTCNLLLEPVLLQLDIGSNKMASPMHFPLQTFSHSHRSVGLIFHNSGRRTHTLNKPLFSVGCGGA